jgi:amino acid transporter
MPQLVKFMLRHALIGAAAAILFVAAVMMLDVGGLATLVSTSTYGALALALLTFFTALTFGGMQMGIAVMSLKERDEEGEPKDGEHADAAVLQAVPVRVTRRR